MSQLLVIVSYAFHSLATAVFIGYFLLMSLFMMPALLKSEEGGRALGVISQYSRPWMYGALAVFALTGTYLTLGNADYEGIGAFHNPWAVLMLVKHIVIMVMALLGFVFNAILRVGAFLRSSPGSAPAAKRFRLYHNVMSVLGTAVLVLTAVAQMN